MTHQNDEERIKMLESRIKELVRQREILLAEMAHHINNDRKGKIADLNSRKVHEGTARYLTNPEFRGLGVNLNEFIELYKEAAIRALRAQGTIEDEYDSSGRGA